MNPLETKWLPQPLKKIDMVVVGVIFFSLFLDIDGQSLRLRGPAIRMMAIFFIKYELHNPTKGANALTFQYINLHTIKSVHIISIT